MKTKEKLLALLEASRGQNISGEFIAGELGISRAAVWKAIKELEKDGYKITAATRTGYRLEEANDILSAVGILQDLGGSAPEPPQGARPLTPTLVVYPSLESTNITAKQAAISGAEHFTVILADYQTSGKGRYGKSFFSPQGCGVYMSFVLRPSEIWLDVPTLVTAFAAVAVCEAIEAVCEKRPQIKWVNDIFLDGKKICGISNEAGTDFESGEISWIVTGIGVNFRVPDGGFPEEIRQVAGAVFGENGENPLANGGRSLPAPTRNRLAAEIIRRMSAQNAPHPTDFLEKYRARMLFLGEKITVHSASQTYEATALDIDDTGRLVVRTDGGEIRSLSSGEVSVRRA